MAPKHALLSSSGSSGLGVGGINVKEDPCSASPTAWIPDAGMVAVCTPRNGKRKRSLSGMMARWLVIIGAVLMLMMQSSLAADGKSLMLRYDPTCKSGPLFLIAIQTHHQQRTSSSLLLNALIPVVISSCLDSSDYE